MIDAGSFRQRAWCRADTRVTGPSVQRPTSNQMLSIENAYLAAISDLGFRGPDGSYAWHHAQAIPARLPPQLPRHFVARRAREGDTVIDPMPGHQ